MNVLLTGSIHRSSRSIATQGQLDLVWKSKMIPLSGEDEVEGSWTHTLRWSDGGLTKWASWIRTGKAVNRYGNVQRMMYRSSALERLGLACMHTQAASQGIGLGVCELTFIEHQTLGGVCKYHSNYYNTRSSAFTLGYSVFTGLVIPRLQTAASIRRAAKPNLVRLPVLKSGGGLAAKRLPRWRDLHLYLNN